MKNGGSLACVRMASAALGNVDCDLFDDAGNWAPVASEV